jgi:hypothetical protein
MMKVIVYKVTGAHPACDHVYYKDWPDMEIENAFDGVVDVGDKATVTVEVVEVDQEWLDNLQDANDF